MTAAEIKRVYESIKILLRNLSILNGESTDLLGQSAIVYASPEQEEQTRFPVRIAITSGDPDAVLETCHAQFTQLQFNCELDHITKSIKWIYKTPEGEWPCILHVSKSVSLLKWIWKPRPDSKWTPVDLILLLKAISDFYPKQIYSWYDTSLYIIDNYTAYEFSHVHGLCQKVFSFKGKNGYLNKGQILKDLTRTLYSDVHSILETLLGVQSTDEWDSVEAILELVNSPDWHLRKRRALILKRWQDYRSNPVKIGLTPA